MSVRIHSKRKIAKKYTDCIIIAKDISEKRKVSTKFWDRLYDSKKELAGT